MYLKSIEVHGFKSFANKIVFEFHHGITGIVGPNGSGKSNVADAVRWVLGEQSAKQLRGAKMEDVIFSGTQIRKPVGFAYVALTLDNSDHKLSTAYTEVKVARRVYRSGESEYLINGTSCRLRDVQELFLDTGIGKEGYSIIGQGQIDKILSGKPEDRRELFDEAAGIAKFKKRKNQAERNLDAERQNLLRINDILSEIEKQIDPLEEQSIIAKEYLKLKDELKSLDVNLFLLEYDRNREAMEKIKQKISIAVNNLEETKIKHESTKEEYIKLEKEIEKQNLQLEEGNTILNESKLDKEQQEGEIKVLEEQILAANQNQEQIKERIFILKKESKEKEEELVNYQLKIQQITEEKDKLHKEKIEVENNLCIIQEEIFSYKEKKENEEKENIQLLKENTIIQTKLAQNKTILEQSQVKKAEFTQKFLESKSQEIIYQQEIERQQEQLSKISNKIETILEASEKLQQEIENWSEKVHTLRIQSENRQLTYHRKVSNLESLQNITERYEGYGTSIRHIMEQKKNDGRILGVVADIIRIEEKYEIAIEVALGGSIQNIVIDEEKTAKQLIEYLKKNRFGRATFLPLTAVSGKSLMRDEAILKQKGVIGFASTLVEAEAKYDSLLAYLLGRIVVVDKIDNAISLAKKYQYSLRIVTLEGERLSPGGSLSGGAYKNSSNLLSRRREIEEGKKKIKKIEQEIEKEKTEIELLEKKMQEKQELLKKKQGELQEWYLSQNTAKLKYQQAVSDKEILISQLLELEKQERKLKGQIEEGEKSISVLSIKLQENEKNRKEKQKQIEEETFYLEKKKEEEKQVLEKNSHLKMESSAFDQSSQFVLENKKRVELEIQKFLKELKILEESQTEATLQIQERKKKIQRIREQIQEKESKICLWRKKIEQIQLEKEKFSKSHKGFLEEREVIFGQINNLEKECYRLNSQKEKLEEQLERYINYMWEEYELTYHHALDLQLSEKFSLDTIKKEISELKNKIKELGSVNVNAIEDYKTMNERYLLLKTQRDDIIKAEEVLVRIIEELDQEMREQFKEKFKLIQEEFNLVFQELFGGGKGTLELIEEEDILEAGIRIIAQPPGKKLQNIMQLSGGEKALTAISLLFAIQNLKPSPFCLLDEIEAALDDSNVTRYAKYLHKLTKNTQFIVITHRRGTMMASDVLYGITMQEKGVSSLISVNLANQEDLTPLTKI